MVAQVSISQTFYVHVFCMKVLFCGYVLAKKALWHEKRVRKMLMKLTPDNNTLSYDDDVITLSNFHF